MPRTADDIVRAEVLACVSSLIRTLAQGCAAILPSQHSMKEICDLAEQAQELAMPIPDWEEAAIQAGWTIGPDDTQDGTFGYEGHGRFARSIVSRDEAARLCCELNEIDPYDREVFEHWIVSDWLADKLLEHGEKVDKDFANLCVWARTGTGFSAALDPAIQAIAEELNREFPE